MRRTNPLGLLHSGTGSHARLSEACRTGALRAIAAIDADSARAVTFAPQERDPGGDVDLYAPLRDDLPSHGGARHVVGRVTSSSRKEVIPTPEKHGGTLWYAAPCEGFEASDHVVCLHACPNQHLLPLLGRAMPVHGRRGFLVGSNYTSGWEMNRLARDTIRAAGGEVAGERHLPIGSTDVARMIAEMRATAPDFVLNALIGPSSYAFLEAYASLGAAEPRFAPDRCPVLSCNLTECELGEIGAAGEGPIAAGPYFRTGAGFGSSFEAAASRAVHALADLLEQSGDAARMPLGALLASPAGRRSGIDPETHHAVQRVLIAQVRDGAFHLVHDGGSRAGDPYPTGPVPAGAPARLRVVS